MSRFGPIQSPCADPLKPDAREETMQRTKTETERARSQNAELANYYRAIGPADLQAALICASKKTVTVATPAKAA